MTATLEAVTNRALSQVGGYYPDDSPYGVWYDNAYGGDRGIYDNAQFCAMGLSWTFWNEDAAASSPTDELAALHPAHRHVPGAVATLGAGQDTGGPGSEPAGTPVGVLVITRDH